MNLYSFPGATDRFWWDRPSGALRDCVCSRLLCPHVLRGCSCSGAPWARWLPAECWCCCSGLLRVCGLSEVSPDCGGRLEVFPDCGCLEAPWACWILVELWCPDPHRLMLVLDFVLWPGSVSHISAGGGMLLGSICFGCVLPLLVVLVLGLRLQNLCCCSLPVSIC